MEKEQATITTSIKQLTVRMTESMYEETKKEADQIGSSHNSFLMMMIKLGMKLYNSDVIVHQELK